jgi:hypothetical protein
MSSHSFTSLLTLSDHQTLENEALQHLESFFKSNGLVKQLRWDELEDAIQSELTKLEQEEESLSNNVSNARSNFEEEMYQVKKARSTPSIGYH